MLRANVAKRTKNTSRKKKDLRGEVLDVLRELLSKRQDEAVVKLVSELLARNKRIELQLTRFLSRRKKGEGVSTAQLNLFLDELALEGDAELDRVNEELKTSSQLDGQENLIPGTEKLPKPPRRNHSAPSGLRRVKNPIPVPEEERLCPKCGTERVCIGHDETEIIELVPAEVIVRVDQREKLACKRCEGEIVRAPLGDKVVEGGIFGSRFVSALVVEKYRDGLPLNRLREKFKRLGFEASNSTLADQIGWAAELLRPLWRAASAIVLGSHIMQFDGTGLIVRQPNDGQMKLGSLWAYIGDDTAVYLFNSTGKKVGQRPGELGPEDMLAMRVGFTVADASTLFDASFKRKDLIECGCNAHARSYFTKALDVGDQRAALPLAAYKKMYKIERRLKGLSNEERLKVRQAEIKPIFDKLKEWCKAHKPHEPPSSKMGDAIRYFVNQQQALGRFLEDGAIPIDNSAVERLHIRVALTRKNYLFAGSNAGAERAAIIYTILACCAMAEVNPIEYLSDILPKLARGGIRLRDAPDLLPAKWKEKRSIENTYVELVTA